MLSWDSNNFEGGWKAVWLRWFVNHVRNCMWKPATTMQRRAFVMYPFHVVRLPFGTILRYNLIDISYGLIIPLPVKYEEVG